MTHSITAAGRLTPAEVLDDVHVTLLLDESSSMVGVGDATRSAANDYIAELQSGTPVRFSLAVFGDDVTWRIKAASVDIVRPLATRDYRPMGMTALYDAIGQSIERIDAMDIPPVHPVVVVFTDGEDSSSAQYDADTLRALIEDRRRRGWRFIAFIAGDDAREAVEAVGMLSDDVAEYAANDASTKAAFRRLATSTKRLVDAVETMALPPAKFLE
jgi:uncharacterized protein YegL